MKNRVEVRQIKRRNSEKTLPESSDKVPERFVESHTKEKMLFRAHSQTIDNSSIIKSYKWLILLVAVTVIAIAVGVFFLLKKSNTTSLTTLSLPGQSQRSTATQNLEAFAVAKRNLERPVKVQVDGNLVAGTAWCQWYKLGLTQPSKSEPEVAKQALAQDQLFLGEYYLAQNDQTEFAAWQSNFVKIFAKQGELMSAIQFDDSKQIWLQAQVDFRVTQGLLRLVIMADQKWPNSERQAELKKYLNLFYQQISNGIPALHGLNLKQGEVDTWYSTAITPTPSVAKADKYISLGDIDLWTISASSQIDSRFKPLLAQWQKTVKDGVLALPVPLAASGVNTTGGYINGIKNPAVIEVANSCSALRALGEVGVYATSASSFLAARLAQVNGLSENVSVVSGDNMGETASPATLGMIMRFAATGSDKPLWQAAKQSLAWFYAASNSSPIKGAYYRVDETGKSVLYANDNLIALLALQTE